MNLQGHREFTQACNIMNSAIEHIERASSHHSDYAPFLKSARALRSRMQSKWEAGVKKGRREGWFK